MGLGGWLAKAGEAVISGANAVYEDDLFGTIGPDEILGKSGLGGAINRGYEADIPGTSFGLDEAAGGAGAGLQWVDREVLEPAYQGITRPITTALLMDDWGDDWSTAWEASGEVSPFQAFWAGIGNKLGDVTRPMGLQPSDVTGNYFGIGDQFNTLGDPNFDIRSESDREIFKSGGLMVLSGTGDAVARFFLDPTVVLGKAAALTRTAAHVMPVKPKLGETREEFTARVERITSGQTRGGLSPSAINERRAGRRLDTYTQFYMGMSQEKRHVALLRDPNLRQHPALAEYFARAGDEQDFRLRMRTALNPTARNLDLLEQKSKEAFAEFTLIHDEKLRLFEETLAADIVTLEKAKTSGDPRQVQAALAAQKKSEARRNELVERVKVYGNANDEALLAYTAADKVKNVPRVQLSQRAAKAWEDTTGLDWWTYQPSRYSAMRVLRSVTTRRAGVVVHDEPTSAVEQTKRLLDRAGVDAETHYLALTNVSRAATTRSTAELKAAVVEAERVAVQALAKRHGIREDVADELIATYNTRRDIVQRTFSRRATGAGPITSAEGEQVVANVGGDVFSGAPVGAAGDWTMTADQVKNIEGILERHPLGVTDLENQTPLLDLDVMNRLMIRENRTLTKHGDEVSALLRGGADAASKLAGGREHAEAFLEAFNRAWKPAQLLRLGWPMRVITDESLRAMSVLGAMQHLKLQRESLSNSLTEGSWNYGLKDAAAAARARITQNQRKLDELTPAAKTGRERLGIVDELERFSQEKVAVATAIEEARTTLAEAMAANGGRRAYMAGGKRTRITGRPEGATFRLDDYGDDIAPNSYVHDRVLDDVDDPSQMHAVRSNDPRLGVAYLADTMEPDDLSELRRLSRRALVERVNAEFPDLKLGGFRSADDVLAAYGGAKAKAAGLRTVERQGREVLVLDDTLIRKVDPAERAAIERLEDLRTEQYENAARVSELTGKRDELDEWTQGMQEDYDNYLSRARVPSSRARGSEERPLKFGGEITLTKNGITVSAPDAFGGTYGRVFMDLTSADSTMRSLSGANTKYLNDLRIRAGETAILRPIMPDGVTADQARLLKASYDSGWTRAVNDQIGKDAMLRLILLDKTNDEILDWLNNTAAGREHLRKIGPVRAARKEEWIANARTHVQHYLPAPELRQLALEGRASIKDLHTYKRSQGLTDADLPVIHAQALDEVVLNKGVGAAWGKFVERGYQTIGTAPTDVLSRHPFFAGIYRREMRDQFDALMIERGDYADDVVPASLLERMERNARQTALREVKRTLYDVANESNMAHTMRFIMPFYAAWQDALQTWSRLWVEDPARLARLMQVWQAPQQTPAIYENSFGEKFMALPLPEEIKGALGIEQDPGMPVNWMRDLIFNGEYWYNPGVGVPVTVPLGAILRDRPDLEETLRPLMPYGAGESWKDQVAPTAWKRGASLYSGEDDASFVRGQWRIFQDVFTENRLNGGGMSNLEMWDEARKRNKALHMLRVAGGLGMPFAPNFRSPYQYYIDRWQAISEEYRLNPDAFGGKSAQDHFLDTEGEDYFIFTMAATKSNVGGIAPTEEGFKAFQEHRDMIRQMPEMGSLIVGDVSGEYSGSVATYMQQENIGPGDSTKLRSQRDPKQGLIDAEISRGWAKYRQIDNAITAMMESRGLTSLRSAAAADLVVLRDAALDQIGEDYPAWKEDFGTFDRTRADRRVAFMEKLVDDSRYTDNPGFRSLAQYLAARRNMVTLLAQRAAAGGSDNLQANSNADLQVIFEALVAQLKEADTDFADLHTRWLGSDNLTTGGEA